MIKSLSCLSAQLASLTFAQFATEPFLNEQMQTVAQRSELYGIDHFVDKCEFEQQFGFFQRYAALAHIEQGGIVELAHCASVCTLHVVSVYLKHRLGVYVGVAGGTDVLVAHFRDCLLGSGAHEHTTGKGSLGLSVEHILIKLVACTVRHTMVYQSIVVHMLPLVGYHAAVKPAFGPLTRHDEIGAVARNAVVQRDDVVVDTAAGLLLDIQIAHSHVLCMRLLKAVKVKTGIVPYVCLYDLRGQKTAASAAWSQNNSFISAPSSTIMSTRRFTIRSTSERNMLITCTARSTTTFFGTYTTSPS